MRRLLVAASVAALVVTATGAHAEAATIKKTHTMTWIGDSLEGGVVLFNSEVVDLTVTCGNGVLQQRCRGIEVRPGENYLHVILDASWTTSNDPAAIEVETAQGWVLVCGNTMSGPLDITGLTVVRHRTFINAERCPGSALTLLGKMVMYFSDQPVSLGEAYQNATLDNPTREGR